jgi:uncharacterized protein (DUF362 family)
MRAPRPKTRRQFLKEAATAAGAASLAGLASCFPDVGGHWPYVSEACLDSDVLVAPDGASRVAEVFCDQVATEDPVYELHPEYIRPMLEAALGLLGGTLDGVWKQAFPDLTSTTRVGLKVNCLNQQCATSVPLVKALVDVLHDSLGVGPERIIVWDRSLEELSRCKFTADAVGAPVMGTVNSFTDGGGPGYGEPTCGAIGGRTPRLSRILTDLTDVTINLPVLKTHDVSGVTGSLKNIYGVIDIPASYHTNLVTFLPQLYRLPPIRRSLRLHIVDALRAVAYGSTSDSSDVTPKKLLASLDPVALDKLILDTANDLRANRPDAYGGPMALVNDAATKWLDGSQSLGLGTMQYEHVSRTL